MSEVRKKKWEEAAQKCALAKARGIERIDAGVVKANIESRIRDIFGTVGLNVMPPFIAFSVPSISSEQRHELLQRYRQQPLAL